MPQRIAFTSDPNTLLLAMALTCLAGMLPAKASGLTPAFRPPQPIDPHDASANMVDAHPGIETDGNGTWNIIWESEIFGRVQILAAQSVDGGRTWSAPRVIESHVKYSDLTHVPMLANDHHGHWIALWADAATMESRSSDNGTTWSAPTGLVFASGGDEISGSGLSLVTDDAGTWLLGMEPQRVPYVPVRATCVRSRDLGATWSDAVAIDTRSTATQENDGPPALATNGHGRWGAVWPSRAVSQNAPDRLMWSSSNDDGSTWNPPTTLLQASNLSYIDVESDGNDTWIIALGVSQGGIIRSVDCGQTWTSAPLARKASGPGLTKAAAGGSVHLATDRRGDWIVVDEGFPSDWYAFSTDNGATWSDPAPIGPQTSPGADLLRPGLAADRGKAIAVWSDASSGADVITAATLFFPSAAALIWMKY